MLNTKHVWQSHTSLTTVKDRGFLFLIIGELVDVAGYYKLFSVDGGSSTLVERKFYMYPDVGIPVWMMSKSTEASLPKVLQYLRTRVMQRVDGE